ncbi:MAG: hypothetical protein WA691_10055 [Thermoplasmata archaeon]
MSENGPREGTRDLPRPGPETGRRTVDEDSTAGIAYGSIARSMRRRRSELVALMEAGGTVATAAQAYASGHPLEPHVTTEEIDAAVAEAQAFRARKARAVETQPRPRAGKTGARD